ncbi:MAG TPA: hypothetical protein VEK07_01600 [Polyangiaceae bacterium]|nr:hypothetical protein [Polyangiaceae bacterium]
MFPGASFCEWLTGSYWRFDAPTDELSIELALEAIAPDVRELLRDRVFYLSGTIDAERLAARRAVEGTLCFKRLSEGQIRYRIRFFGIDGARYELSGHKEWNGLAPLDSVTLLVAKLLDESDEEVGRATLRFDLRSDWLRFLRHLRLRL